MKIKCSFYLTTASANLGVHEYFFLLRNLAWFWGQHRFVAFCMLFIKWVIDCSTPYDVFILRYLKSSNSTITFFLYSSLSTLSQSILSLRRKKYSWTPKLAEAVVK
jgi:hypothetical protein